MSALLKSGRVVSEKQHLKHNTASFPIFNLAFRPFFLLGSMFAAVSILLWVAIFAGQIQLSPYGGSYWWHIHEMLFGFVAAIIAGFLLTAVQTWTGVRSVHGKKLILLVGIWLSARLLLLAPSLVPQALVIGLDMLFLPMAAYYLAKPIIKVKMWRNLIFVPILMAMSAVNAALHYLVLSEQLELTSKLIQIMVLLVSLVMCIIGGRVFPMFTANGTKTPKVEPIQWLENISIFSVLVALILNIDVLNIPVIFSSSALIFAGCANFLRGFRWRIWSTLKTPLVWSLHVSYWALALGLIMLGLAKINIWFTVSIATHAITVGGMGLMILSMISRVSLGHTGRRIVVGPLMTGAFIFMLLAFITRVFAPLFIDDYLSLIWLSGLFWSVAFGCFLYAYFPVLIKPRVDGKVG